MDFIERVFHIAPDGGSGLTELAIVLVGVFVLLGVYWLRGREGEGEAPLGCGQPPRTA